MAAGCGDGNTGGETGEAKGEKRVSWSMSDTTAKSLPKISTVTSKWICVVVSHVSWSEGIFGTSPRLTISRMSPDTFHRSNTSAPFTKQMVSAAVEHDSPLGPFWQNPSVRFDGAGREDPDADFKSNKVY